MTAFAAHRRSLPARLLRLSAAPLAAGLLAMPHMLPGAELRPLDAVAEQTRHQARASGSGVGDSFPGSAYFFAEGAFVPDPGVAARSSAHIFALAAGPAAPAVAFRAASTLDAMSAESCLTSAIYYEAASEPDEGQRAVAQVVLNRVRSRAYPNTVCGVVYQDSQRTDNRCQFTFACDGALARRPSAAGWLRAGRIAREALSGQSFAPVGMATHYHTLAVRPFWSSSLQPVAVIGAHIFYRPPGVGGSPAAFTAVYAGREPTPGPHPRAATASVASGTPLAAAGTVAEPLPWILPAAPASSAAAPVAPAVPSRLPQSGVRPEYQASGRPLI